MKISWIEEGKLAASSVPVTEEDIRSIHQQGIRAIVSAIEHPLTKFNTITEELFEELGIETFHVAIPDTYPPTLGEALAILDFIDQKIQNNQPVLIHCHAGIGRTGTLLHLYYINHGHNVNEAKQKIKRRRIQNTLITSKQKPFLDDFYNYIN